MSGIQVRQSLVSDMIVGCPRRVYLTYIELLHVRPSIALFIGSMFHYTYEFFFKQKLKGVMLSLNDLVDYYSDRWNKDFSKETVMGGLAQGAARMIGFSLITIYWRWAKDYDIASSEEEGFVEVGEDRIITHTDIRLKSNLIIDIKSSRVLTGRNGDYFPDYSERNVQWKPQPMIHMLAFPGNSYEYNVVGKGERELIERPPVKHSLEFLERFKELTLAPVFAQLKAGNFPAVPSPLCSYCEWSRSKKCGVLL